MKFLIAIMVFMGITVHTIAQNPLTQNMHDLKIKDQAKTLRNQYDRELILMGEQELIFENKIEEYLINAKKIRESTLTAEAKYFELRKNYSKETADMSDILSRPQYEVYKKIKEKYQPRDTLYLGDAKP